MFWQCKTMCALPTLKTLPYLPICYRPKKQENNVTLCVFKSVPDSSQINSSMRIEKQVASTRSHARPQCVPEKQVVSTRSRTRPQCVFCLTTSAVLKHVATSTMSDLYFFPSFTPVRLCSQYMTQRPSRDKNSTRRLYRSQT